MKFAEFDLRPELLEALSAIGFTECTPIQEAVIPSVLKGKDVSGLAQTGTGKTGAFVIPLMDRILRLRAGETGERVPTNWKKNSFVLVLVPTRELAAQVEGAVSQFGKNASMRSVVIVGGSAYDDQKKALHQGVEFVVGTPGRILDLYKSHDLDLNGVAAIVFDEADRMFDMGFKDDMTFILRRVPRDRQFLLFSATLNFEVLNTSYQFGAEPVEFNMSRDSVTAEGIDHSILHVGQEEKPMFLLALLKKFDPKQCIVFSNFKHNVTRIAKFLKNNGIEAMEMSSLLSQAQRNRVFESFRSGKKQILVATDVAARGLDVKGIDLVVNYDLPDEAEGYIHRIGRTGRAGGSGRAVGMVSDRDVDALGRIEAYLKDKVKVDWLEESELIKEFKPFPTEFERDDKGPQSAGRRPALR
ncbi:MAG: DEAD/DEAH box helicase, partial [Oligoflexia bacterium]|nr:DEAD/DEAH box helicase [Oligoflexia bacterium]